jgi:hypothetical protein
MCKKIIAACMALAAFATFAAAATPASATTLTQPTGTAVSIGTKFKATNVGIFKFFSSGLIVECSKVVLTGSVIKNNGVEVEGTIETASFKGTGFEERCTSNLGDAIVTTNVGNGVPWCLKAESSDILTVRGNSCTNAARSITFVFDIGSLECKYERTTATGPIAGTYTTDTTGDAIGSITPSGSAVVREGTNVLCPATGALEGALTLETDPISGSASPMYIS